jgi:hypothetical protein
VYGDGKQYSFFMRDHFGAVVHQAEFETQPNLWQHVYLPFSAFRPNWFGYPILVHPPLNTRHIVAMSLLIEHKQAGAFTIEVASIWAYR